MLGEPLFKFKEKDQVAGEERPIHPRELPQFPGVQYEILSFERLLRPDILECAMQLSGLKCFDWTYTRLKLAHKPADSVSISTPVNISELNKLMSSGSILKSSEAISRFDVLYALEVERERTSS